MSSSEVTGSDLDKESIESLVDTGADITTISQDSWNPTWLLWKVSMYLLGIGTLSQITQQSLKRIECIGPCAADRAMNLGKRFIITVGNTDQHFFNLRYKLYNGEMLMMTVLRNDTESRYRLPRLCTGRPQQVLALQSYKESHCWQSPSCPAIKMANYQAYLSRAVILK